MMTSHAKDHRHTAKKVFIAPNMQIYGCKQDFQLVLGRGMNSWYSFSNHSAPPAPKTTYKHTHSWAHLSGKPL